MADASSAHLQHNGNSSRKLRLENLPSEICDLILACLDSAAPSEQRFCDEPTFELVKSDTRPLKTLSQVSRAWRYLTLPWLFRHVTYCITADPFTEGLYPTVAFHIGREARRLNSFLEKHSLHRYVSSLVVYTTEDVCYGYLDRESRIFTADEKGEASLADALWPVLLSSLNPDRVVILAPPLSLGSLTDGVHVDTKHAWAFDSPLQSLQVSKKRRPYGQKSLTHNGSAERLFDGRQWSELAVNEGSFIRAYSTYEYFLKEKPSTIPSLHWRALYGSNFFRQLTSLHYNAIFPFYNTLELFLNLARICPNVTRLSMQLAPSLKSGLLTNKERIGTSDLRDMWMELESGYQLIIFAIKDMTREGNLREFRSLDYVSWPDDLKAVLDEGISDDTLGWQPREPGYWATAWPFNAELSNSVTTGEG
ncbi:hypothetical protein L228DRAFT_241393 [Xylona heveae TC161]|uniref:F-box domain-containing protein n=1 Tax=Xylona heveae (strain CBS 132557 / TC161) TaxID=1328760 RepID=A0A164ZWS3_XYLHT|nr:hypothetical protein L228DRAFT_241393 [Xylona heveae TC161]KZF19632.1 hypothetical protein L228DRAFT_241393 [Xylona heveae TC161]